MSPPFIPEETQGLLGPRPSHNLGIFYTGETSARSQHSSPSIFSSLKMPKVDFPVFDGTNARS